MGLRKRYPWAVEQKELEATGYKFNDKGECTYDPFKKKEPVIKKAPPVVKEKAPTIEKETKKKQEPLKKKEEKKSPFKKFIKKNLKMKKSKKRGK